MIPVRPTLKDIARIAGVDVSTVSRVLRSTSDASTTHETRARILATAAELNYRPNVAARVLRRTRSNYIGVVVHDLTNSLYHSVVEAAEATAIQHGQTVILFHVDDEHMPAHTLRNFTNDSQVDGLIIASRLAIQGQLGPLESLACPFVLLNAKPGAIDTLTFDHGATAVLGVDHLVDLGHRRLVLFPGGRNMHNAQERVAGFRTAASRHDLVADDQTIVATDYRSVTAYEASLAHLKKSGHRPIGVIAATVPIALGVTAAAADIGLRIPDEVAVVALQDSILAETVRPALTTVVLPAREMGELAVKALLAKIEGKAAALPKILSPTGIVIRGTTMLPVPHRVAVT